MLLKKPNKQSYLHIPRSPQRLQWGCAGGGVGVPSCGGVLQLGVWLGVLMLLWRVLLGVLLAPMGPPSLLHLWVGRLEVLLPWQELHEGASPDPWGAEH